MGYRFDYRTAAERQDSEQMALRTAERLLKVNMKNLFKTAINSRSAFDWYALVRL